MIRNLILPASVCEIAEYVFDECRRLRYADLSAAHGSKSLGSAAFRDCRDLEQVMLNGSLETICSKCFEECGFEKITFPRTLRRIEDEAFILRMPQTSSSSRLRARFLWSGVLHGPTVSEKDRRHGLRQVPADGLQAERKCPGARLALERKHREAGRSQQRQEAREARLRRDKTNQKV